MMASNAAAGPSTTGATRMTYTTREWVIPARPKPGRKPKPKPENTKKTAASQNAQVNGTSTPCPGESPAKSPSAVPEPGSSSNVASRPAQKAFRERKQDYVLSLEARCKQLEADEGEKAVLFQRQALRYKTEMEEAVKAKEVADRERESLRKENDKLKRALAKSNGKGSHRWTQEEDEDDEGKERDQLRHDNATLRSHADALRVEVERLTRLVRDMQASWHNADAGGGRAGKRVRTSSPPPPSHVMPSAVVVPSSVPLRLNRQPGTQTKPVWQFAPAVSSAVRETVHEEGSDTEAACSGDPANCPACRDDPFGQAFCSALSANVCSSNPCADCPNATGAASPRSMTTTTTTAPATTAAAAEMEVDPVDEYTAIPCCGHPELCGSASCQPEEIAGAEADKIIAAAANDNPNLPNEDLEEAGNGDAMPCSDAWRQLKAHPNIGFANLQLLADVVARRTRCDGPSPSTPHRPSPLRKELSPPRRASSSASETLVVKMEDVEHHAPGPHTSSTAIWAAATTSRPTPPPLAEPALVPHATLLAAYEGAQASKHAGSQTAGRRLTVDRRAVKEALAMLDRAGGGSGRQI